jgi:CBS domain containing-hemolysin-like protein
VLIFGENTGHLVLMFGLLLCSSFFSGSETAFFNLSRRQVDLFGASSNKFKKLASGLLSNPKRLLTSLLFGNMVVNVLFFALASVLSLDISNSAGRLAGVFFGCTAFVVLLLFGEMLPKSLAYRHSTGFSTAAAGPCFLFVRAVGGVLRILEICIVAPAVSLLAGGGENDGENALTGEQLKLLIESSRQRGLISADENQLFAGVVELGALKVRDVMRPRVDMTALDVSDSVAKAQELMASNKLTQIAVYAKNIDNIIGSVAYRDLLLSPSTAVSKLVKEVHFVPEQKSVESLLEFFRSSKTDMSIVVDEYGGIAGIVFVEDVAEELLGPMEPGSELELIEQIGPLRYRLAATLPIHDWAHAFGIDPGHSRVATIGGLTTALLGKIPRPGDTAYLKNVKLTVEEVQKRRIKSLVLSLEDITQTNG